MSLDKILSCECRSLCLYHCFVIVFVLPRCFAGSYLVGIIHKHVEYLNSPRCLASLSVILMKIVEHDVPVLSLSKQYLKQKWSYSPLEFFQPGRSSYLKDYASSVGVP